MQRRPAAVHRCFERESHWQLPETLFKVYPAGLERPLPTRSSHHTTGPPAMIQNMCHDTPPWYQRYRAGNDWRVRASFSSGLPIARLSLDLELRE